MKRILVGVDGSPESKRAAAAARTLAEALKTELVLAYVVAPFTPPAPQMYIPIRPGASRPTGRTARASCTSSLLAARAAASR